MAEPEDDIAESWEDWEDSGELDKKKSTVKSLISPEKKSKQSSVSAPGLVEDGCRTAYQPQVRILRRDPDCPDDANKDACRSDSIKPTKSLEEREAAYAEARLRILGDSGAEDASDQRPAALAQQFQEIKVTDNIVRQPHGPDGGRGFGSRNQEH